MINSSYCALLKAYCISMLLLWGGGAYALWSVSDPIQEESSTLYYDASRMQDKILSKLNGKAKVGVHLWSLKNDRKLFSSNSSHAFVPASNIKIFTAIAGLLSLGSNYTFDTLLLTTTKPHVEIQDNLLKGDVYFKFGGDPSLTKRDLQSLVNALEHRGIHKIYGNIYIDSSEFNGSHFGPGWAIRDIHHCYAAPVSAVIIDHNCFGVLHTQKKSYQNNCLKKSYKGKKLKKHKKNCRKPKVAYFKRVQRDPGEHAKQLIAQLFSKAHISYSGHISSGVTPANALIIHRHHSAPLNELLRIMLKNSDNLFADAIFKKIGAQHFHQAGNWNNASRAVKKILTQHTHINFDDVVLRDGSGISIQNSATPEHFTELLNFAYHELPNGKDFILALPISGRDGTLAHRMRSPKISGRVHAKTGTMHHVAALSGYVETHHKDILIFSIIVNGVVGSLRDYRSVVDEWLMESVQNY